MENQIEKINPTEYGLQESEVTVIEQAFMPKIVERDALKQIYEGLLTKEITPELCKEAGDVRKKLVKVRTGIADIHKTQKAFYLAAGRFVDAWKNKETTPIEQMEENLRSIETHYEKIEAERIQKLEAEAKAIAEQKAKEVAAAAPDREKIIAAVNSIKFELPECKSEQMQAVANTINQKFESFKKWAIEQTNTI